MAKKKLNEILQPANPNPIQQLQQKAINPSIPLSTGGGASALPQSKAPAPAVNVQNDDAKKRWMAGVEESLRNASQHGTVSPAAQGSFIQDRFMQQEAEARARQEIAGEQAQAAPVQPNIQQAQEPRQLSAVEQVITGGDTRTAPTTRAGMAANQVFRAAGIAALAVTGVVAGIALAPTVAGIVSSTTATGAATKALSGFSYKKLVTLGVVGGAVKLKAGEAQSILTTSMSEMEQVIELVETNQMTYEAAQEVFNTINQNIQSATKSATLLSKIDVTGFLALKDTLVKFEAAQRTTIPSLNSRLFEAAVKGRMARNAGVMQ